MARALIFVAIVAGAACKGKASYTFQPWNQQARRSASTSEVVRKMRAAILTDPMLSRYYFNIGVAEENRSLIVSGTLPSQQLKDSLHAVAVRLAGDHVVDRVAVTGAAQ